MKPNRRATLVVALATVLMIQRAEATPITFTGSGTNAGTGHALSATVTFDISGTDLVVTLTNTSSLDVTQPSDVLTAIFFNVTGNPGLTRTSAAVSFGSSIIASDNSQTGRAGTVVGGEWAYKAGLAQYSANQGISSSGLGIFGRGNFPGAELQGPPSGAVSGVSYGITSAGDNAGTVNGGLRGQALIQNAVQFTLGGLPGWVQLRDISAVTFQYGSALNEPSFGATSESQLHEIPEPSSIVLLSSGLSGLAVLRRWRRHGKHRSRSPFMSRACWQCRRAGSRCASVLA